MQNLQANFLLYYFKTFWFWVWRCSRPSSRDAEATDAKLRSISADKKRKKYINAKKKHDCLTTGLRTVCQSLKFMIFVISSTIVKELKAKFASKFFVVLIQNFLVLVLNRGSHKRYIAVNFRGQERKKVSKSKNKSTCKFSTWLLNKWLVDSRKVWQSPLI